MTDDIQKPRENLEITQRQFNILFGIALLAGAVAGVCLVWGIIRLILRFT